MRDTAVTHRSYRGGVATSTTRAPRRPVRGRTAIGLHLLDGPYVTLDGACRDVPESSQRLLAFCALHPGRLDRSHVAGTLWASGEQLRTVGNLRSALWRLRSTGLDLIISEDLTLRLDDGVQVDVREVTGWAQRLIDGRNTDADLQLPRSTVAALDLLPGWYDDWAVAQREGLSRRVLQALEILGRRLIAVGRYADAVDVSMLAVGAEPLRESAQRVLVEAHLVEGNWFEACRSFRSYRERLRDELGVEPSAGFRALLRAAHPAPVRRRVQLLDAAR
jgi:DNA-binding SARP family transcriptional activator